MAINKFCIIVIIINIIIIIILWPTSTKPLQLNIEVKNGK